MFPTRYASHAAGMRLFATLAVTVAFGCKSPTEPTAMTRIQVDGFLTWNDGSPIPGIQVDVLALEPCCVVDGGGPLKYLARSLSDSQGHYALSWSQPCSADQFFSEPTYGLPPDPAGYRGTTCSPRFNCTPGPQRVNCVYQR
jgi:hypothetical protein